MLYEDMYKYKLGSTVKANCTLRVVDPKKGGDGHTAEIKKVVEGKVINSSSLLVCGEMENWYTLLDDKDNVYKVVEDDVLECK